MMKSKLTVLMIVLTALLAMLLSGCQTTGQPLPTALTGDTDQVQQDDELARIARGHRYEP